MKAALLNIAMISLHSSPIGELGTRDTGGMSVYISELARELGRRGHRIDIFTCRRARASAQVTELYANVRLVQLNSSLVEPMTKAKIYHALGDYFGALERFRIQAGLCYDLIHSHYWLSGMLGHQARNHWSVPHIIMFHTLGASKNRAGTSEPEPEIRIANEKRLINLCHRILAATKREKEDLMRFYNAVSAKISVVPCGVNLNRFRPLNRLTARQQLGFDADELLLLYVGRFDPIKGLDRLISALCHLQNHPRLRLVIVGGDGGHSSFFKNLQRLVRNLGLEHCVTFAGRVEHSVMPLYFCAANVLVIPSRYESFGLAGLEALACGTPVVAAPVGAFENVLREGQTGHVVSDETPLAFARGIEIFLPGPSSTVPAPEAVRASVLEFDWSKVAAAVTDQYTTVLKKTAPG
ncbi:MAG: glycosyltransferase [Proteobacteria bacterium]|nr:glycosyltransferase [Pseudomonadota bacterium]